MVNPQAQALIEWLNDDMRQAMKDGELVKRDALRAVLARISNAEAVAPTRGLGAAEGAVAGASVGVGSTEVARRELTLADVQAIIRAEADEIEAALVGLDEASSYAGELRAKLAVVRGHVDSA